MKKYLGSIMTAYAAVMAPLFVIVPFILTILLLLNTAISGAVVAIACMLCCGSVVWCIFIKREILQLYAWGYFEETYVKVVCPFIRGCVLDYEKCRAVGIGCYTHGVLNSRLGSKTYFIYFSYDYFDAKYSEKINLWKPTTQRIKVQFNNKLYAYLLSTLPKKQAKMLEQSYRNSPLGQMNLEKN